MAFDQEVRDALIEQVRRFVTEVCVPAEADVAENDEVPQSIVDEMKALTGSRLPLAPPTVAIICNIPISSKWLDNPGSVARREIH